MLDSFRFSEDERLRRRRQDQHRAQGACGGGDHLHPFRRAPGFGALHQGAAFRSVIDQFDRQITRNTMPLMNPRSGSCQGGLSHQALEPFGEVNLGVIGTRMNQPLVDS